MIRKNLVNASLVAVGLLLLAGCAQNPKVANLDSYEWTTLTCSGFSTWNECRQEALAICPKGFYISDQLENYTIQRREVSVACKA
ncbi:MULTISPECIES: hypothetical protein [Methylotenera]|uniref:hypothetical protein n=1 Tax=Methylotenera TaxID=359407 RepID=UPI00036A417D|nr:MULTISPECIES: hypothetical protein [Methylotenera]